MLCSLLLGLIDALLWSFEIAFMANTFEAEVYFNFEVRGEG